MYSRRKNEPSLRDHYAGFVTRLMAVIIDALILAFILAISNILWSVIFENANSLWQMAIGRPPSTTGWSVLFVILVTYFTFGIYYIFLWTAIGTTIGGIIMGTKVVNEKGRHPSILQALIRFAAEFLIPVLGAFGAIWIFFSRRRRALFDRLAGTFVIYNWDARLDETFLKKSTDKLFEDSNANKNSPGE